MGAGDILLTQVRLADTQTQNLWLLIKRMSLDRQVNLTDQSMNK